MGLLTATLLIFGRLSADQELTAVRAGGISLLSLISPVLLLSVALCIVSALVNMEIGPRCRVAYKKLIFNLRVELSNAQLPEGRVFKDLPGYLFSVGKNRKGDLRDVIVYDAARKMTIQAPRGRLEVDTPNQQLNLHLYDARGLTWTSGQPMFLGDTVLPIPLNPKEKGRLTQRVSDMTFSQLWTELQEVERQLNLALPLTPATEVPLTKKNDWRRQQKELTSRLQVQIHEQVAFSFACFGFALVGIPLGIRMHRRETNIGVAIALVLVAIYYSFVVLAKALDVRPEFAPHLIVWLPNFIFQTLGAVMLWRANRGV